MIKTIEFPEYKKLSGETEFERYKIILQYFNENPERIEPNERYLTEVIDRLTDLSMFDKKVPQNLRDLIFTTLQDFLKQNNGYEYI